MSFSQEYILVMTRPQMNLNQWRGII